MNRQDVDRELASVRAEHERIAAALYAMDTHPAHALLAGAQTTGATARAWSDAKDLMSGLWVAYNAYVIGVEMAADARSRRTRPGTDELAELTHLLTAPVIPTDPGAASSGRITLGEAASRLAQGCEAVTEVFDKVVSAHAAVAAGQSQIAADLAELERLVVVLGDPPELKALAGPWAINADPECAAALRDDANQLFALRERLAAASAAAAADPVGALDSADPVGARNAADPIGARNAADPVGARNAGHAAGPSTDLRRLAAAAAAARARLAAAVRVKTGLADRIATIDGAVREVAAAEDGVRRSYAAVVERIADPGLPPAPDAAVALAAQLAEVRRSVPPPHEPLGAAVMERLDAALAAVERGVDAAGRRAADLRVAADGLLDRRAELRGRLDAYRVKGIRLGFAEHPDLTASHRLAHDLLHTRPCDLPAATRAVHGYQHLLATLAGPEEERMRR